MAAASVAPAAGLREEVAALVRRPALVRVVVALLEGVADHVRHEALVPAHPAALRPVRGDPRPPGDRPPAPAPGLVVGRRGGGGGGHHLALEQHQPGHQHQHWRHYFHISLTFSLVKRLLIWEYSIHWFFSITWKCRLWF